VNTTRTTRLLILNLAALTVLVAVAPNTQGADPFVAGGRSSRPVAVSASETDRSSARGAALAKALGLPGVTHRAERLDDRFEHRVYDEVTSFDARGREVAISRFDADGRVVMAVGLGWRPGSGRTIAADVAARRASEVAAAAGLSAAGRPTTHRSAGAGGWAVTWPRVVDGVRVAGDGLRVLLWNDGSFHGLARQERPLAAAPARPIPEAAARATAEVAAGARFGQAGPGALRIVSAERAWVAPNDTWDPAGPDAPGAVLRLAWIIRFETSDELSERVRLAEFWIDAGDSSVIGGDLVE
jgi:hypothetical protein